MKVRCIVDYIDGITKGKEYDAVKSGYDTAIIVDDTEKMRTVCYNWFKEVDTSIPEEPQIKDILREQAYTIKDIQLALSQLTDMVNQPALILKNFELTDKDLKAIDGVPLELFKSVCKAGLNVKEVKRIVENVMKVGKAPSLPADYEMTVNIEDGDINIGFFICGGFFRIGYISLETLELYMLSDDGWIENYKLWREKGCLYNERTVEFKGGVYGIGDYCADVYFGRIDIESGVIYNITECFAQRHCEDPNVLRHAHNNVPIIF